MSTGLGVTETITSGLSGFKVGIVWSLVEGKNRTDRILA
jgi:hypothetical protein